jgi:hypothetical protein
LHDRWWSGERIEIYVLVHWKTRTMRCYLNGYGGHETIIWEADKSLSVKSIMFPSLIAYQYFIQERLSNEDNVCLCFEELEALEEKALKLNNN